MLLVDETRQGVDIEIEGLLLEVLSDFAVTVPELGTITAERPPFVVLTPHVTRESPSEVPPPPAQACCLFLHIDFPDPDLGAPSCCRDVPELPEHNATGWCGSSA